MQELKRDHGECHDFQLPHEEEDKVDAREHEEADDDRTGPRRVIGRGICDEGDGDECGADPPSKEEAAEQVQAAQDLAGGERGGVLGRGRVADESMGEEDTDDEDGDLGLEHSSGRDHSPGSRTPISSRTDR